MTKIVDNEVYTNGKIEVKVLKHFSRLEDGFEKGIDFVFAVNTETNETIIRTEKEFCEEFIAGLEKSLENFFDSYISNGQYEPKTNTKEDFVDWFDSDYILDIASDSSGIPVYRYMEYAPIYYDKKFNKKSA